MNCRSAASLFSAFLEDELNQKERRSLEAHLLSCKRCSLDLREFRATLDVLPSVPVYETSPHFEQDLLERIRSGEAMRPGVVEWLRSALAPDRLRPVFLAGAGACAVFIGFTVVARMDPSLLSFVQQKKTNTVAMVTPPPAPAPAASTAPVNATPGDQRTVSIPAGTVTPKLKGRAGASEGGYAWAERAVPAGQSASDSVIPNPASQYDDEYIQDQFYLNRTSTGTTSTTITPVSDQASDDATITF